MTSETERLGAARTVLLTTYRKNGTAVPTPVSLAVADGELLFASPRDSGKVKRIRNDGKVLVQACNFRGTVTHGPAVSGQARILDATDSAAARRTIARKYGVLGHVLGFFTRLRGPEDRTIGIAVKLDG